MTTALGSTLTAISLDPATTRRIAVLAALVVAIPVCVSIKGIDNEVSAHTLNGPPAAAAQGTGGNVGLALPLPLAGAVPANMDLKGLTLGDIAGIARFAPRGSLTAVSPFRFAGSVDAREQAIGCLAAAAWYEAGNDDEGQRSVIQVVLNRVKHPSFPKTVCGVVLQGSERRTGCQFSFTCDGSLDRRRPSPGNWQMARLRAESALEGAVDRDVADATHYHADYVTPWWSSRLEALTQVGRHIFYRWPGSRALSSGIVARDGGNAADLSRLGIDTNGGFVGPARKEATPSPQSPQIKAEPIALIDITPSYRSAAPKLAVAPNGPIVMALEPNQPAGRWAVDALRKCSGSACRVLGYVDPSIAARNAGQAGHTQDAPQFVLIKDRVSGMTLAFWDCDVAPRSNPDQCLPRQPEAVRSLIRDRSSL